MKPRFLDFSLSTAEVTSGPQKPMSIHSLGLAFISLLANLTQTMFFS